jgi:hypothetical protein
VTARRPGVAQAWIEPLADDPEAWSAETVARTRLAAGRTLIRLRRVRLIELTGALPRAAEIAELLHRSTQFYNPHKERAHLRTAARDRVLEPREHAVLVSERGGERRPAAERWWTRETGQAIEVREGVAWLLTFAEGTDGRAAAADLATLRDRRRGLLGNPISQEIRVAEGNPPLPWLAPVAAGKVER